MNGDNGLSSDTKVEIFQQTGLQKEKYMRVLLKPMHPHSCAMNRHLASNIGKYCDILTPTGAKQVCNVCTFNNDSGH
jgi:hypothetical protein